MLTHFFKVALRNLWKQKIFTTINILGLAIAVAAGIPLILTSLNEFSFDRFHENGKRIYRVYKEEFWASGKDLSVNMPAPLTPAIYEEMPQVEHAVRWQTSGILIKKGEELLNGNIRYTDPAFFEMFSFNLIKGNPQQVLQGLNDVVVSESFAEKLFGNQDPMGQSITFTYGGQDMEMVVSGVLEDAPDNSTLDYELVTRFENSFDYQDSKDKWDNRYHTLFVQLPDNYYAAQFEEESKIIVDKYYQEEIEQLMGEGVLPGENGEIISFKLQPFYEIHFNQSVREDGLSFFFPLGLLIIALFILAIASFNFINLKLGGIISRAKEVGVRKVLGAFRQQLLVQFWGEALLMVGISLLLGLALAQFLLPEYNRLFRQSVSLYHPHLIGAIAAILIITGLVGGGYPAFIISKFRIADVLRKNTSLQKGGRLRNGLLLIQFAFSIVLIICTIIVYLQIDFLRTLPLGYNKQEVVSIPLWGETDSQTLVERMRNELAAQPAIQNISAGYRNFGLGRDGSQVHSMISFEQEGAMVATNWISVDYDFFETMEIPFLAGRSFSRDRAIDTVTSVIINETFAKELKENGDALNIKLETDPVHLNVIGIVEDFHFQNLSEEVGPLTIVLNEPGFENNYLFIRIDAENTPKTMAVLEDAWKKVSPQSTFNASFLDENNNRLYGAEEAMGKIFFSAAGLAIFLSCLGLFGIALLVISRRTKEIGIRKVLGASIANIIGLVSKEFIQTIGLAIIIASPLAWWAMRTWLSDYANRIEIQWWIFPLAGAVAIIIAFLTLSIHSIRAALSNPVKALRDE